MAANVGSLRHERARSCQKTTRNLFMHIRGGVIREIYRMEIGFLHSPTWITVSRLHYRNQLDLER